MKAEVFQKIQELNPAKEVSVILIAGPDALPSLDLVRPFLSEYPGIEVQLCGRKLTPKVQETISRHAESAGSMFRQGSASEGSVMQILNGIRGCRRKYFVVSEGNQNHPLELVQDLLTELDYGAELAVASRIYPERNEKVLELLSNSLSFASAKHSLRKSGVRVRDPLSGYFAGKTSCISTYLEKAGTSFDMRGANALFQILKVLPTEARVNEVNYLVPSSAHTSMTQSAAKPWYSFGLRFRS